MDYQKAYLRAVVGFVCITDRERSLSKALRWGWKNVQKRWRMPGRRLPL
jgi:hypothetical protein